MNNTPFLSFRTLSRIPPSLLMDTSIAAMKGVSLQQLNGVPASTLRFPFNRQLIILAISNWTHLDLSLNTSLKQSPFLASLTNLEHLNLSFAASRNIPHALGNLTRLRSLDVGGFPNMVWGDHLNHYHSIHLAGYPEMEYVAPVTSPNVLHVDDNIQWLLRLSRLEALT
ncbi:hypothetical protein SASPL_131317 [Salvia splendens]|uniref:LRR receptor-like serine/threonine-protein kinase FLS2 n=1 Tax=Salvia splendens TaxID=180675 RepID=A0A8X8ZKH8_SALSN|nr:hypothetical protein SASPL_131317 [Salvia splendens]